MNEATLERNRINRLSQLGRTLSLSHGETLDDLIAAAMPTGETIDPRGAEAFCMHYGMRGYEISEMRGIAKAFGLLPGSARFLVVSFEFLFEEIVRGIRNEKRMPNDHAAWPLEDFFTGARARQHGFNPKLAGRIKTVVIQERARFPTVLDFCRRSEDEVMAIPTAGVATTRAMQEMLASVDLSLGMNTSCIKKAA